MGKKKSHGNKNNRWGSTPKKENSSASKTADDDVAADMAKVVVVEKPPIMVFGSNYDEFDEEIDIPMNGVEQQELMNISKPVKHAYKTAFLSHEDVTSPTQISAEIEIPIARPRSRASIASRSSSKYNLAPDGGAYEEFHSSRNNLNHHIGDGDNRRALSHRSLYSDGGEERSLAGFPQKSFGGSRASIHGSRHGFDEPKYVNIARQDAGGIGELESLNWTKRSRSNSGASNGFSVRHPYEEKPRSRTASECSRKAPSSKNQNNSLQTSVRDVRSINADSDLQHGLSTISIRTNNDEFVLVGGRPQDYEEIIKSRSRTVSTKSDFGNDEHMNDGFIEDELGRSISQRSLTKNHEFVSRASSRHTVGTTSNTDDRLLLAQRHSQLPEAEGLLPMSRSRSTSRAGLSENVQTLIATEGTETLRNDRQLNRTLSRSSSVASNKSERVNFADIPELFSHPDDNFNENGVPGVPFRPTSEHKFTPSNSQTKRKSIREEVEQAMVVTSALTPVAKRIPPQISISDESPLLKTPETVQRVTEVRSLRQTMQNQENAKKTMEIAIQTGDTIRMRQGKWNADVLSELADLGNANMDYSPTKTMSYVARPKMNNSFERNGHPAASVLNNMLQNRVNPAMAVTSDPDVSADVRSSGSNSSHQVTMVHNSNSQTNMLSERLRHISERYQDDPKEFVDIDENGNVEALLTTEQFENGLKPLSTSTPAKSPMFFEQIPKNRKFATSGDELETAFQKTGSEKSVYSTTGGNVADAKWEEGKRAKGDTLKKHVPRGRIRAMANVFESIASPNQNQKEIYIPRPAAVVYQPPPQQQQQQQTRKMSNMEETRSRTSSSRRESTMSSNAFKQSSQTIGSQEEKRSTTNIFTRNTFVRSSSTMGSNLKIDRQNLPPPTVPITTYTALHEENPKNQENGEFVGLFEKMTTTTTTQNRDDELEKRRRSTSVSPNVVPQAGGFGGAGEIRINQSYALPVRGDMFRRSMPNREPIRRTTPILRRQTTTVEKEIEIPKNAREVPIRRVPKSQEVQKKRMERAKTQEVSSNNPHNNHHYDEPSFYGNRAASGTIGGEEELANKSMAERSFFAQGRETFGRQTTEDLSEIREKSWKLMNEGGLNMFEERRKRREEEERLEKQQQDEHYGYPYSRPLAVSPKMDRPDGRASAFEKHPSKLNISTSLSRHTESTIKAVPYSPPTTEDAGSRITHNTLTTFHDDGASVDNRLTTEDSSIRGKIDRMFDFVEDESSTHKNLRGGSTIDSRISTSTVGRFEKKTSAEPSPTIKYLNTNNNNNRKRVVDEHREWEKILYDGGDQTENTTRSWVPERKEDVPLRRHIQSPERRNTVTVMGGAAGGYDDELEYSLSQYREMQREQLRRRLSSAEEPKFFRSPSLSAPHAGQSLHAYRTRDICGTPTIGEKIRLDSPTIGGIRIPPAALATSTPIDSPQSMMSFSLRSSRNVQGIKGDNETFVSSISGMSAIDNKADVERKINRLSYMIENTQKQLEMNEAALVDAMKTGKNMQELQIHRSILISRESLKLQRGELRKLHALTAVRRPPPPVARDLRGSVVFNDIVLNLNKNYVGRWTSTENSSYAFVTLFKCGHQVEATECVQLKEPQGGYEMADTIIFEKQIQFSDVPVDFSVVVEFYAMRVPQNRASEASTGTSFATRCKNLIGPPQKKSPPMSMETAFKSRGRIVLDRDAAGERCFYLDDVNYPLEGTVMMTTTCSRLPDAFEVDFRGFLTMFLTISGMASWQRLWAVLRRGVVFFWQYPDDEQMGKEPKMQIDLTKCTNNTIEQCAFDVCPKPYSFAIEILVATDEMTVGSIVEKKRVLLSADSGEMLNQWLFALNKTLDVIRGPI